MFSSKWYGLIALLCLISILSAQNRTILVPKPVPGAPFMYDDQEDYFGQAYRWFIESEPERAVENLKTLLDSAGIQLDPKNNYYVVVAHFMDKFAPIGIIHEDTDFFSTRMYGLKEDNLYYIFISRTPQAPSFLSVMATAKDSPFLQNLPGFLGLFGVFTVPEAQLAPELPGQATWVDVRQFNIPKAFRDFSDLSFIVKKDLAADTVLAQTVFDNSAKERWSYGIAFALTSVDEVDIVVGSDGRIIVQPKPTADVSVFGVINYHFWAVDTKAKTLGNSLHLLGGLRIGDILEPIVGLGGGVDLGFVDVHAFVGYSVEFTNKLKNEFNIGDQVTEDVDPFDTKVRGKPRFGLEIKFP